MIFLYCKEIYTFNLIIFLKENCWEWLQMYETGIIHNQGGGVITAKSSQKDYLTGGGLSFQNLRFNKNVLYILLFSVLEKCENVKMINVKVLTVMVNYLTWSFRDSLSRSQFQLNMKYNNLARVLQYLMKNKEENKIKEFFLSRLLSCA